MPPHPWEIRHWWSIMTERRRPLFHPHNIHAYPYSTARNKNRTCRWMSFSPLLGQSSYILLSLTMWIGTCRWTSVSPSLGENSYSLLSLGKLMDRDLQMDECLPFTGAELVQSPVLGQTVQSSNLNVRARSRHQKSCTLGKSDLRGLAQDVHPAPQPPMLFEHSTLPNTTCPHAHMPYLTTCRDCSDGIYAVRAPLLIIKLLLLMLSASSCSCLIMCGQALDSSPELLMMATPCTCPS